MFKLRNLRYFSTKLTKNAISKENYSQRKTSTPKKSKEKKSNWNYKSEVKTRVESVNISIINADGNAGMTTAFYLKQHPLVKKIFLYGGEKIDFMTKDLNGIDTNANVVGFTKERELPDALRVADIIILMDFTYNESNIETKFRRVAPLVKFLADECGTYAPRAVIINCIEPVSCTMPLMQATMRETFLYNPGKIVGCVSQAQARVNSQVANYLSLDPESVHVPIIGGSDNETMVVLLSQATPNPSLGESHTEELLQLLLNESRNPDCSRLEKSLMSEGYPIAQLALVIARGICGGKNAMSSCLIRSNMIPMINYIATTVRFGRFGLEQSYGVPNMNKFETRQFMKAVNVLLCRERMVEKYIKEHV